MHFRRNKTSFASQATYILNLDLTGTAASNTGLPSAVYVADRFQPYVRSHAAPRYVWLPIRVDAMGNLSVTWESEWKLPLN